MSPRARSIMPSVKRRDKRECLARNSSARGSPPRLQQRQKLPALAAFRGRATMTVHDPTDASCETFAGRFDMRLSHRQREDLEAFLGAL